MESFSKILKLAALNILIVTFVGLTTWLVINYLEGEKIHIVIIIFIIITILLINYLIKEILIFYRQINK